jgi:type I restriction enzyme S subunit
LVAEILLAHFKTQPFLARGAQVMSGAVGQQRVPKQYLLDSEIPLAPLPEQRRIAEKLDTLLERVDACLERLSRIPGIIERFRQSVLAAATTGELTREWREEQGIVAPWQPTSVADVAASVFDGPFGSHLKSKDYVSEGVRVVRLENIAPLRFIEEKRTYISREKYEELTRHTLFAGDIIFSSFVAEEVRVCLLPAALDSNAINKADCFCIRVNASLCQPAFLAFRLACRSTFDALEEGVHGATRPRVNLGQLKGIAFELPTLDEQEEIVRRCNALLMLANALEQRILTARRYVEHLVPSTLAKAFRGELVPQDPNDEPASESLARLRSRLAGPSGSGRPKRGGARGPRAKLVAERTMPTSKDHLASILKKRGALTAEVLWAASQLDIDDFYAQLKDEEARGLLREHPEDTPSAPRLLKAVA